MKKLTKAIAMGLGFMLPILLVVFCILLVVYLVTLLGFNGWITALISVLVLLFIFIVIGAYLNIKN